MVPLQRCAAAGLLFLWGAGCSLVIDSGQYVASDGGMDSTVLPEASGNCEPDEVRVEDECFLRCDLCPEGLSCDPDGRYCVPEECDADYDGYYAAGCGNYPRELQDCDDDNRELFPGSLTCDGNPGCSPLMGPFRGEVIRPRPIARSMDAIPRGGTDLAVASDTQTTLLTWLQGGNAVLSAKARTTTADLGDVPAPPEEGESLNIIFGTDFDRADALSLRTQADFDVTLAVASQNPDRLALARFTDGVWQPTLQRSLNNGVEPIQVGPFVAALAREGSLDRMLVSSPDRSAFYEIDSEWSGGPTREISVAVSRNEFEVVAAGLLLGQRNGEIELGAWDIATQRNITIAEGAGNRGPVALARSTDPPDGPPGQHWLLAIPSVAGIEPAIRFVWYVCDPTIPAFDCFNAGPRRTETEPGEAVTFLSDEADTVFALISGGVEPVVMVVNIDPGPTDAPTPLLRVPFGFPSDAQELGLTLTVDPALESPRAFEVYGIRAPDDGRSFEVFGGGFRVCTDDP
ncbi:MAG: hypothetical protein AAGF12_01285 [Myxococcota bacterium]